MTPTSPPVRRREIVGWAFFDFANSAYTTVVVTAVYSAFFVAHIVPAEWTTRDTWWSVAMAAASVVTLGLAPLVGAACDLGGHKKRWLLAATLLCSAATIGLVFVRPGDVVLGVLLVTLATVGFNLSETFCASFLPELADDRTMARISAFGWGLGYFGGLASLIVVMFGVIRADEATDLATWQWQNRLAMVVTGLFFAVAALPTFLFVKERSRPQPGFEGAGAGRLARAGLERLLAARDTASRLPNLTRFFVAFVVYMAGLQAVIKFVGIYAREEVALSAGQMVVLFLILQVSAAAGALAFGFAERWLGPVRTVTVTLLGWVAATVAIYFVSPLAAAVGAPVATVFFALAVVAGSGLGSVQSSSRAVVGLLAPAGRSAEIFGLWGLCLHVANILGMTFGVAADAGGSRRAAMLLITAFFAVGAILLQRVRMERSEQAAG
jgi:UMF1 family MFS transporter